MYSNFIFFVETIVKDGNVEQFVVRTNEGRVIDMVSCSDRSIQDVIKAFLTTNVSAH